MLTSTDNHENNQLRKLSSSSPSAAQPAQKALICAQHCQDMEDNQALPLTLPCQEPQCCRSFCSSSGEKRSTFFLILWWMATSGSDLLRCKLTPVMLNFSSSPGESDVCALHAVL